MNVYQTLKAHIIEVTGMAYYLDKDEELQLKLRDAMTEEHLADYSTYLQALQDPLTGPALLEKLVEQLTIGETYFFRHREQFQCLQQEILPSLIAAKRPQKSLNIWCAGCSTGEEAYSLAILLDDFPELHDWQIEILATDINPQFLRQAQQAVYRDWSFRNNPEAFKERYFAPEGTKWQLLPFYQQKVRFLSHNLMSEIMLYPRNASVFDLIFCRNVLIYFSAEAQQRLILRFHQQLRNGGWLLLGPAELSVHLAQQFALQDFYGLSCFQKQGARQIQPAPKPRPVLVPNPSLQTLNWKPYRFEGELQPLSEPLEAIPVSAPQATPASLNSVSKLVAAGAYDQALQEVQIYLEQQPLDPVGHYYCGLVLAEQEDLQAAEKYLNQAVYLDRKFIMAHYHLGILNQKKGNPQAAQRAFKNTAALLKGLPENELLTLSEGLTVSKLKNLLQFVQKGDA